MALLVSVVLVGGLLVSVRGGWASGVVLRLAAEPTVLAVAGEEVTIVVKVDLAASQELDGVEAQVTYDPALFDYVSSTVDKTKLPTTFPTETGAGWVHLAAGAKLGSVVRGPFDFARIRFRSKGTTSGGSFGIDTSDKRSNITLRGAEILGAVQGVTVPVGAFPTGTPPEPTQIPLTPGPQPSTGPVPTTTPKPTLSPAPTVIPLPAVTVQLGATTGGTLEESQDVSSDSAMQAVISDASVQEAVRLALVAAGADPVAATGAVRELGAGFLQRFSVPSGGTVQFGFLVTSEAPAPETLFRVLLFLRTYDVSGQPTGWQSVATGSPSAQHVLRAQVEDLAASVQDNGLQDGDPVRGKIKVESALVKTACIQETPPRPSSGAGGGGGGCYVTGYGSLGVAFLVGLIPLLRRRRC